jgi:hypothetical protein
MRLSLSLAGGDKWREGLRKSAGACRVAVCLVTENWLAPYECQGNESRLR